MKNLLKTKVNSKKGYVDLWNKIYFSESLGWYHNSINWFYSRREMLERMFFWGWKLRWNFDFHASSIHNFHYLKLTRIYRCMIKHGHLQWNSSADTKLMRRLCEAKELAKILAQDNFDKNSMLFLSKYRREDVAYDSLDWSFRKDYPNAKALSDKQYVFYFRKALKRDRAYQKYVGVRFYALLEKYQDHWWD